MGDFEFLKYLVCAMNGWNPNSNEVQSLKDVQWLMLFHFLRIRMLKEWQSLFEPAAELVGYLTHPEIYKVYSEYKEKQKNLKESGRALIGGIEHVSANSKYVPGVGLVDIETHKVVLPESVVKKDIL
jgi:hypothetical protein